VSDAIRRLNGANGLLALLAASTLVACGGGDSSEADSPTAPVQQPPPSSQTGNRPPTISGTPQKSVVVGQAYSFKPAANDPDGDSLTFTIQNKPSWASFDEKSGRLTGTPQAGDVGTTSGIVITVSDGLASASLAAFSITVDQIATGSVTLDWTPPTQNTDGSALKNLAGYRILYGKSPSSLTQVIDVANPGLTSYVVQNLSPATWYFAIKSYNSAGVESLPSNPVSATVN